MSLFLRHVMLKIKHDTGTLVINADPNDQLFIEFNIKHKANSTPLEGELAIYNLNRAHEDVIRQRGTQLDMFAGYRRSRFGLIASCDVRRVDRNHLASRTRTRATTKTSRSGLNRITRVHIGGQIAQRTESFISVSFSDSQTVRTIVQKIIEEGFPNMTFGNINAIPIQAREDDYLGGGRAGDVLTRLLAAHGLTWYEDANVIFFTKNVGFDDSAIRISERTGLIGSPTVTIDEIDEDTGLVEAPTVTEYGVRITTLLDHRINLASELHLTSNTEEAQGDFKVEQLQHRGNNRDGRYVTEIEAISPETAVIQQAGAQ